MKMEMGTDNQNAGNSFANPGKRTVSVNMCVREDEDGFGNIKYSLGYEKNTRKYRFSSN